MKPDRFVKMVKQHAYDDLYIPNTEAATLLRRQFSQVRRVVVKRPTLRFRGYTGAVIDLNDLLAALDAIEESP